MRNLDARTFATALFAMHVCSCAAAAPPSEREAPAHSALSAERARATRDTDGDGIADERDACPSVAEDCDRFEDDDGCPDLDDDRDGILDACDRCPREPETPNGTEDDDGCPDTRAVIIRDDIRILPHIVFASNSARIDSAGMSLVDEIARTMQANSQIERVLIRGNASIGERAAERLSEQRARVVRDALVSRGVEATRIEIRGDGTTRPLAPNITDHGRAMNRRIDFEITQTTPTSSPPTPVIVPRSGPPRCPGFASAPPPSPPPPGGCARNP